MDRIAVYRTAVVAGLYDDWRLDAGGTDSAEDAVASGDGRVSRQPFTLKDFRRLGAYKAAVDVGFYSDGHMTKM